MRSCTELKYQAAEKTLKETLERLSKGLDDKHKKALNKAASLLVSETDLNNGPGS